MSVLKYNVYSKKYVHIWYTLNEFSRKRRPGGGYGQKLIKKPDLKKKKKEKGCSSLKETCVYIKWAENQNTKFGWKSFSFLVSHWITSRKIINNSPQNT